MQQNTKDLLYISPVMRCSHFQLQWEGKDLVVGCRIGNVPFSEVLPKDPHLQPSAAASLLLRECMEHFLVLHYHCVRKCFAQKNEISSY